MKSLTLDIAPDYNFDLIGICCHSKDFRLCWEINHCLSLDFVRTEDFKLYEKRKTIHFPFFEYHDEENGISYYLIKNQSDSGFLIPEEKKIDYFFILKGQVEGGTVNQCCKQLRKASVILTLYPIDITSLKSKQNLIF